MASVSHAFCSACDRTRLTADGQVRSCLFSTEETDLRALLRNGADDAAVEAAWRSAMWAKPAGHGINDPELRPARATDERDRRMTVGDERLREEQAARDERLREAAAQDTR